MKDIIIALTISLLAAVSTASFAIAPRGESLFNTPLVVLPSARIPPFTATVKSICPAPVEIMYMVNTKKYINWVPPLGWLANKRTPNIQAETRPIVQKLTHEKK